MNRWNLHDPLAGESYTVSPAKAGIMIINHREFHPDR